MKLLKFLMLVSSLLKKFLTPSFGGAALIHAIVFWVAWAQNGGFGNSIQGFSQKTADLGRSVGAAFGGSESIWVQIQRILGEPCIEFGIQNHAGFIAIMIVNSILWGIAIGVLITLARKLLGKK